MRRSISMEMAHILAERSRKLELTMERELSGGKGNIGECRERVSEAGAWR